MDLELVNNETIFTDFCNQLFADKEETSRIPIKEKDKPEDVLVIPASRNDVSPLGDTKAKPNETFYEWLKSNSVDSDDTDIERKNIILLIHGILSGDDCFPYDGSFPVMLDRLRQKKSPKKVLEAFKRAFSWFSYNNNSESHDRHFLTTSNDKNYEEEYESKLNECNDYCEAEDQFPYPLFPDKNVSAIDLQDTVDTTNKVERNKPKDVLIKSPKNEETNAFMHTKQSSLEQPHTLDKNQKKEKKDGAASIRNYLLRTLTKSWRRKKGSEKNATSHKDNYSNEDTTKTSMTSIDKVVIESRDNETFWEPEEYEGVWSKDDDLMDQECDAKREIGEINRPLKKLNSNYNFLNNVHSPPPKAQISNHTAGVKVISNIQHQLKESSKNNWQEREPFEKRNVAVVFTPKQEQERLSAELQRKNLSATTIQKHYRGHQTRSTFGKNSQRNVKSSSPDQLRVEADYVCLQEVNLSERISSIEKKKDIKHFRRGTINRELETILDLKSTIEFQNKNNAASKIQKEYKMHCMKKSSHISVVEQRLGWMNKRLVDQHDYDYSNEQDSLDSKSTRFLSMRNAWREKRLTLPKQKWVGNISNIDSEMSTISNNKKTLVKNLRNFVDKTKRFPKSSPMHSTSMVLKPSSLETIRGIDNEISLKGIENANESPDENSVDIKGDIYNWSDWSSDDYSSDEDHITDKIPTVISEKKVESSQNIPLVYKTLKEKNNKIMSQETLINSNLKNIFEIDRKIIENSYLEEKSKHIPSKKLFDVSTSNNWSEIDPKFHQVGVGAKIQHRVVGLNEVDQDVNYKFDKDEDTYRLEILLKEFFNFIDIPMSDTQLQNICKKSANDFESLHELLSSLEAQYRVHPRDIEFLKFASNLKHPSTIDIKVIEARDLISVDPFPFSSDPYVVLSVGDVTTKTTTIANCINPIWMENFTLSIEEESNIISLSLKVMDDDVNGNTNSPTFLGQATIHLCSLPNGEKKYVEIPLSGVESGILVLELTLKLTSAHAIRKIATSVNELASESKHSIYDGIRLCIPFNPPSDFEEERKEKISKNGGILDCIDSVSTLDVVGWVEIQILEARDLIAADPYPFTSDPYVLLRLGHESFTSQHISNSLNPKWDKQLCCLTWRNLNIPLKINVMDYDYGKKKDDDLGSYTLHFQDHCIPGKNDIIRIELEEVKSGMLWLSCIVHLNPASPMVLMEYTESKIERMKSYPKISKNTLCDPLQSALPPKEFQPHLPDYYDEEDT